MERYDISIRSHGYGFYNLLTLLKWHLSIKYLIGVFVPFIILQKEVFLLTMALVLQFIIPYKEPKY